jgi:hypothetical protein
MFPGISGIVVGIGSLILVWLVVCLRTPHSFSFDFDSLGEKGTFEKFLPIYLRVAEVMIGIASGSVVLLVGSSAFRAGGRLPWHFASPLFLFGFSIIYGVLFMVLLIFDYEGYRHNTSGSYTRFKYTRNQALGFSALVCFSLGYSWLIVVVTR